jgi:Zn-dependent M28 family amino/carboxypeptidase
MRKRRQGQEKWEKTMVSMRLGAILTVFVAAAACGKAEKSKTAPAAPPAAASDAAPMAPVSSSAITATDLARHIKTLASDAFEGRAPMTAGGEKTRAYIAGELERIGYKPLGGSYFHKVPMVEATLDPQASRFRVTGPTGARDLQYRNDIVYWTKRVADKVSFENADLVFVGYGVVAPEHKWNDYAGVDVKGKTVVMLVNDPGFLTGDASLFSGKAMTYYGRWTYKFEEAARQGAAAALIIHDEVAAAYGWGVVEGSWSGAQLDLDRADGGSGRTAAEGWISKSAARQLFADAKLDYDALERAANKRGFKAVAMKGLKASATLAQSVRRSEDANVVGVLEGSERPDEYVLYMAHWDHLGADPEAEGEDKIFNGAVDNATGVAAMLEIAEKFAAKKPKRSVMIAAVTAEESGLLGSAYLAEHPPAPLNKIAAGFNIDAMLPTPPTKDLTVVGFGLSDLDARLAAVAGPKGLVLKPDSEPEKGYFYRSDHISFAKKGVPVLYADNGVDLVAGGEAAGRVIAEGYTKDRYHKPTDEFSDGWDLSGMVQTADVLYETGAALADSADWPNWREDAEFRAARDKDRAGL